MSKQFLTSIDLVNNQLLNARLHSDGNAPATLDGAIKFNTSDYRVHVYSNSQNEIVPFIATSGTPATLAVGQAASLGSSLYAMRADATFGLPGLATTSASGFMSAAHWNLLNNATAAPTVSTLMLRDANGHAQVEDPGGGKDIANFQWTVAQIALAKQGLAWKIPVRTMFLVNLAGTYVAGTKRLTASANGILATNDGVTTWAVNDRVALGAQTTGTQNGLYRVVDPGTASTPFILERTSDFGGPGSVAGDIYSGAFFIVSEGTQYDNTAWVCSNNAVTIDTTVITFQKDVKANVDDTTIDLNTTTGRIQIKDKGVTYSKIQDIAATSIIGRSANSVGAVAAIAAASDNTVLTRAGGVLAFTAISNAMLATMAAKSVKANATNASAVPTDVSPTAIDQVFQANSTNTGLEFGTIRTAGITAAAVTNAKLANMAANTIKGSVAGGVPADLTAAQVRTIIGSDLSSTATTKVVGTVGNGSLSAFTITHSLGLDVAVDVYRNSVPYDTIEVDVTRTAADVTLTFSNVPTTAQYKYVIIG